MAAIKVRHYVTKPNSDGTWRRYWQPSAKLRAQGWVPETLAADEGEAITRAQAINAQLDAWRAGDPTNAPASDTVAPRDTATARPAAPRPETIAWLIANYKTSRFYTPLGDKTKLEYGKCLDSIQRWAGDMLIRALDPATIEVWYGAEYARAPAMANAKMRVLRRLLGWGIKAGKIKINPAAKPGLIGQPFSGKVWPRDAVALLVKVADRLGHPGIGDAIILNEWIGQREGDLIRLTRTVYRDGVIHWLQAKGHNPELGKGGVYVQLPIGGVAALVERLEAARVRHEAAKVTATTLIVNDATGQPFTEDQFRKLFAAVRAAAAAEQPSFAVDYLVPGRKPDAPDAMTVHLPELQFMHFRHTAVVRMAEAGATKELIRAITGHTLKSIDTILERYLVRTGAMARQAFAGRIAHEAELAKAPALEAGGGQ